ncbi:hypothetical protein [Photobacterium sanguinicancri]|uniref:hypothetical protein n=1 Tax=Photobacterium sanguinicancri TaxID=875932 RepID=UPI003D0B3213
MTEHTKKVIVLGGTGETGRRIIFHLCTTYPKLEIASASRTLSQDTVYPSLQVTPIRLDIYNRQDTIETLVHFDLAIIALGPMDKIGALAHQCCLKAGIDCIDINDSLSAADEIYKLHDLARQQQNTILTGMGFTPGLSGLMLAKLAERNASSSGRYAIRAYMGATYGGGETSPYAMLSNFKNTVTQILDGQRAEIPTPWKDDKSHFQFPEQPKPQALLPYSAVECAGLSQPDHPLKENVQYLDARYHIQYLNQGLARLMTAMSLGQKGQQFIARKFYQSGQNIKTKGKADPDTILCVYPDNSPEQGLLIHGVISSYDLTALMACSATDAWLAGQFNTHHGVFATDQLDSNVRKYLENTLASRGITCRPADLAALHQDGVHFGWVEPVCGQVHRLSNYGANWYTREKQHPRMIALQKQFLLESGIWKALRTQQSPLAFSRFVIRTLIRWRWHNKQFNAYQNRHSASLRQIWKRVTQDISMFTSGYSCARDVLGQDAATPLYRQMFLATGKMEMRNLWPEPQLFSAFVDPNQAALDYWLTFMHHYAALEVMHFTIDDQKPDQLTCRITDCAYAKMFAERGCPELANLIREIEHEALMHLFSHTQININWQQGDNGEATIIITSKTQANAKVKRNSDVIDNQPEHEVTC